MKNLKIIVIGALLLFSSALFSQQESAFTFYRYHMNMINPAYAGVDNETTITGSIRKQWTGIKDAPETQAVSFGTNVGNNLGIGISMLSDKTFVENQTFVGADFSYKVKVSEITDLYLGIKAGGNFYTINSSGLQTYISQSDPSLNSISQFNPNLGIGALIKNEKYYISLSIPRMLNTERAKNNNGLASVATDRPHLYLSGGYDVDFNSSFPLVLKPSVMIRYVNGSPISIDFNAMLQINKKIELGAMYRTDKAFAGLVDFGLSNRLMIGFAYEISTRPELASAKNTNEFFIRFKF